MHVKLKATPGIYLVGFMGCGKSTIGKLLADRLGWDFIDLDTEIERRAGKKIGEIFEKFGELAFRALERQLLVEQIEQVRQRRARVVALGGGAFADPSNREKLQSAGVSIWLECPLSRLWERVSIEQDRPLARDRARFEALYQQRQLHYRQADFTLPADGQPQQIVEAILELSLV